MSNKKVTIFASILAVALFIGAISYASYAFFSSNISESGDNIIDVNTAKLGSKFEDDGIIEIKNMIPGDHITRTFSLENLGTEISYKIAVIDLVNEFESYEDITYVLKENDVVIKEGIFPKVSTNNDLSESIVIKKGEKKSYSITITYQNTSEDQSGDMGKTLSGKLFIKEL